MDIRIGALALLLDCLSAKPPPARQPRARGSMPMPAMQQIMELRQELEQTKAAQAQTAAELDKLRRRLE